MTESIDPSLLPPSRPPVWQVLLEIALVFIVFFLHGAWPTPDVNETSYVTKAQHFWNPQAFPRDFFCNSGDVQVVYFWSFGWLATFDWSLDTVAWIGRVITWLLLAIAWRGLSYSVLPRRWWSVLTAELFAASVGLSTMAGEWIIGGVEAKGFSYALVFWALQSLVRGRWNLAWLLTGAATSLHPLVGGWSMITLAGTWLFSSRRQMPLRAMLPGLMGGALLALPGLWFAAILSWDADAETLRHANLIQLYERVSHHLFPLGHSKGNVLRHLLFCIALFAFWRSTPAGDGDRRLRWFIGTALLLSLIGLLLCVPALVVDHNSNVAAMVAAILRFYWFRVPDIMLPLGVSLAFVQFLWYASPRRNSVPAWVVMLLCVFAAGDLVFNTRHVPGLSHFTPAVVPRPDAPATFDDWRAVGRWAAENTPPGTVFLTPRTTATFKWYSGRDEMITWKDMPQDAVMFVQWRERIRDAFETGSNDPAHRWYDSLSQLGPDRLSEIAAKYGVQYAVVELIPGVPRLPLEPAYENASFAIYRIDGATK